MIVWMCVIDYKVSRIAEETVTSEKYKFGWLSSCVLSKVALIDEKQRNERK